MTDRGRGVVAGRGRASASARGAPTERGSPAIRVHLRGRGGPTPPSLRGADRGRGRGLPVRGGLQRGRGGGYVSRRERERL